ncbi:MAG: GNAT family N-acetyltransferase [bacterium]
MGDVVDFPQAHLTSLSEEHIPAAAEFLHKQWQKNYPGLDSGEAKELLEKLRPHCRVIFQNDAIIGLVATRSNCIEEVWVAEEQRRRGWGTALIKEATKIIKASGFQFAQIGCQPIDKELCQCLDSLDWKKIGDEQIGSDPSIRALVFSKRL